MEIGSGYEKVWMAAMGEGKGRDGKELETCARLEIEFKAEMETVGAIYEGPEVRVSTPLGVRLTEVRV